MTPMLPNAIFSYRCMPSILFDAKSPADKSPADTLRMLQIICQSTAFAASSVWPDECSVTLQWFYTILPEAVLDVTFPSGDARVSWRWTVEKYYFIMIIKNRDIDFFENIRILKI